MLRFVCFIYKSDQSEGEGRRLSGLTCLIVITAAPDIFSLKQPRESPPDWFLPSEEIFLRSTVLNIFCTSVVYRICSFVARENLAAGLRFFAAISGKEYYLYHLSTYLESKIHLSRC